jgi:capsular exopolysaccharide synthesis family protein
MSRMHQALQKAAREQHVSPHPPVVVSSVTGRRVPNIRLDFDGYARLEYERLGVWVKTPTQGKVLQTIAIAGCRAGSGATTTAALMAATLASSRRSRVLLVDANLRTPSLDLLFGLGNSVGLTDVLCDDKPPDLCIQATDRDNLHVLTTGAVPAYPAAVFDRTALDRFVDEVKTSHDFVVFDCAPVLEFPGTCVLAPSVEAVLLVLHADRTSVDDARRARNELERSDARVVGAVLNRYDDHTPAPLRRFLR